MNFYSQVLAEYVWIGGSGELRSKSRVSAGKIYILRGGRWFVELLITVLPVDNSAL